MRIETLYNVVHTDDDDEQHTLSGVRLHIDGFRYTFLENDMHVYTDVYDEVGDELLESHFQERPITS